MRFSIESLAGIKKLFGFYLLLFTVGIFLVVSFFARFHNTSSIGDDYTSLDFLQYESGAQNIPLSTGTGEQQSKTTHITQSQIISTTEVVTIDTAKKIRTPNLESAPRKQKISTEVSGENETNKESIPEAPRYEFRLQASLAQATRLRRLLEKIIISSKFHTKVTPLAVEIVDDRTEPRGRMTTDSVSVIVTIPSESESIRVFVHELGHIIDIHYLQETTFGGDKSDVFYNISWKDHQTKKAGQTYENFVSGYAMTNKYEDFAESFSEFVFANEHFRASAKKNSILQKKYDFFKEYLFLDDEFTGTDFEVVDRKSYIWDTTKMQIAVNKYLYYIK